MQPKRILKELIIIIHYDYDNKDTATLQFCSSHLSHILELLLSNYHLLDMSCNYCLTGCNHCYRSMSHFYQHQQVEILHSLWSHWWVMMDRDIAWLPFLINYKLEYYNMNSIFLSYDHKDVILNIIHIPCMQWRM